MLFVFTINLKNKRLLVQNFLERIFYSCQVNLFSAGTHIESRPFTNVLISKSTLLVDKTILWCIEENL